MSSQPARDLLSEDVPPVQPSDGGSYDVRPRSDGGRSDGSGGGSTDEPNYDADAVFGSSFSNPNEPFEAPQSLYDGASLDDDPESIKVFPVDAPRTGQDDGDDDYLGGAYDDDMRPIDNADMDESDDGYLGGHYSDVADEQDGVFVDDRPGLMRQSGFRARQRRLDEFRAMDRRRRWKWGCSICWCACCLLFLLVLLIMAKFLGWFANEEPEPEYDNKYMDDDDFIITNPFPGVVTTEFEPYERDDCIFQDQKYPSVVNQCQCRNELRIVPNDTMALYYKVRDVLNEEIYNGDYDQPWTSCAPSNMAMMWLSSGNMRDNGDFYQRFILALTFFQLNGTRWDQNNYWTEEESECLWFGLQCNGRFRLFSFAGDMNNAIGELPTELARLEGLYALSLSRNHIGNTIPTQIFSMPKLESLMLYANNMVGSIPTEVGNAKSLTSLRLENNLFFGEIVTEIGLLTKLEEFTIGFNNFWRKIPTEIGLLTNMRWMDFEDNRLSGILITEIAKLSKLEFLLLSDNLLNGPIPSGFSKMSNLQEFRLSHTGLGGTIPAEFAVLTNLHRLEMGFNNFEGTLMTGFGKLTGLSLLALNDNDLHGTIPTEFGNMVNMTRLVLTDLTLTGSLPSEIGRMSMLENLLIDANTLTGTAPAEVCSLRENALNVFVADCPFGDNGGVTCPVPSCCTFCRRSGQSNTVTNGVVNGNLDENGNVIQGGGMDGGATGSTTDAPSAQRF